MTERIEIRALEVGPKDLQVMEVCVTVGQTVAQGEKLVLLEADKASREVEAEAAGRVVEILVAKAAWVAEGALLVVLEGITSDAQQPALKATLPPKPPTSPSAAKHAPSDFHASPWIRRLARERGVDLRQVRSTGPHGRILERDLDGLAGGAQQPAFSSSTRTASGDAGLPARDLTEIRPLSRLQRIVGGNLTANWTTIPHVTQFDEADITELEAFRVALNLERQKEGIKLSLLPFVIKAVAATLAAFPEFNSELSGEEVILKRQINVGIAVDTEGGLCVPVIQQADGLPVYEIAREITRLAAAARKAKLTPTDMSGGSFTISNLGGFGGTAFTPIINAPEVAILGVSKTELKPKWNGSAFVPRLVLPLSLSYDHRVINGVAGARFTTHLASALSDLRRTLL